MVDQLPNRGLELEMLQEMGFESIDDLFSDLPEHVRMNDPLPLHHHNPKRKLSPTQSDYLVQIEQWAMWFRSLEQEFIEIMSRHRFFNW